ncbi:MAG: ABC transporter permease subunit [Phycisphaerae bacterium]|nr:ABC transporter permease subunit [Phycisphaerae bacterium]
MSIGLLSKSWREAWPTTLGIGAAIFFVEGVLSFALPKLQEQVAAPLKSMPFLQNIIAAMIGSDPNQPIGPAMFAAIPWVHPVVLALLWAQATVLCTRVPAGEVDRGTIDVLLGLPVSRGKVFLAETLIALLAGALIVATALAGNALGAGVGGNVLRIPVAHLVVVAMNLFALNIAVGSFALLISALSDRRGRALGATIFVILVSFLLNYLAQFWDPAKSVEWMSALQYHRPLPALQTGTIQWRDIATLLGAAIVFWSVAGVIFARRDLATT